MAYLTLLERKVLGYIQRKTGPNIIENIIPRNYHVVLYNKSYIPLYVLDLRSSCINCSI